MNDDGKEQDCSHSDWKRRIEEHAINYAQNLVSQSLDELQLLPYFLSKHFFLHFT